MNALKTQRDTDSLNAWFIKVNSPVRQWVTGIVFAIISLIGTLPLFSTFGGFSNIGVMLIFMWGYFLSGLVLYFIIAIISFPLKIRNYSFQIYGGDPSSSLLIHQLADTFSSTVLILAFVFAFVNLIAGVLVSWTANYFKTWATIYITVFIFIFGWLPLIALFIINQSTINRIITKHKRLKLAEIQEQIEKLEASGVVSEKETMDKINRLMDYHDRIMGTRNSTFNMRSALNFINSLLLPLLGTLLGQIDQVIEYLGKLFK